jgi:protein farnesyltransferase/geranylgeranyltransferase type-1 subunit alpha
MSSFDWNDITPIPQDDGPHPLASIAYEPEYRKAMDLLRAVMAKEEYSERALALTGEIIEMNPAHYTVWEYRLRILKSIGSKLIPKDQWLINDVDNPVVEVETWINRVTLDNPKNYQVWNYRQNLEAVGSLQFYNGEHLLVQMVLDDDSKNFHAWSHLKWVVGRAKGLLPCQAELKFSEKWIEQDVRNNSAWSYRHFVYENDKSIADKLKHDQHLFDVEVEYVEQCISLAPQNESPWNYLQALYEFRPNIDQLQTVCEKYYPENGSDLKSSHALEMLVKIYMHKKDDRAIKALDLLETYVPVRKGYWKYLRDQLN